MNLTGKKVLLRAIEREDLEFLRKMMNDENLEKYVVGWSLPISKYEQEKWFEKQVGDKDNLKFIAEVDGEPIGLATITNIDWKNRKACHGVKLYSDDVKGKGYGTDIVKTIMKYAFEELQINKLYSTILEYNEASLRLYKKCGWEQEGVLKESVYKNNRYINEIVIGILKEQYENIKSKEI